MTVLDRKLITRMVNPQPGGNGGGGGAGGAGVYVLPAASNSELGGIKLGYPPGQGKYYPVQLDDQQRAYVNVTWTDHHSWNDLTDFPSAAGGGTTPVYWTGSGFSTCTPYSQASVNYAASAGSASSAGYATSAGSAGYATSAGNADTVDNYHASAFLLKSGGDMDSGARISFSGGNGYIGNADNAGWLMVQDICSQNGAGDTYWSLRTNGNAHFANVYSAGYVTALSDARKKKVLGDIVLSAEQIAQMPAVRFEWKDPKKPGMFIGTLAQNWREILPEAVHTLGDDTLSFDYQSAALVSVINLAREIEAIKSKLNRYGFK